MEATMSYPTNLTLIRHGESEGNIANRFSRKGDNRYFTPEHLARHSAWWHLSTLGIEQAKITGDWLRANGFAQFDHCLVSSHLRALETASYLDMRTSNWLADWQVRYDLRERDFGTIDVMQDDRRKILYPEYTQQLEYDRFYTRPPQGESQADLCERLRDWVVPFLKDEAENKNVIMVTHGDTIRALRIILEGITPLRYNHWLINNDPYLDTSNCQIVQYTRINPYEPRDVRQQLAWVRSLCPADKDAPANYD